MSLKQFCFRRVSLFICIGTMLAGCAPSPHDVAGRGDAERLGRMIEENPGLLEERNDMEKTPLHYAVTYGEPEVVSLLIEKGADVNVRDTTGMTPLHVAGTLNRTEEAKRLLEAGADIEARDEFGDTPLHSAAMHGQDRILQLFLEQGADPSVENKEGLTPLELARNHRKGNTVAALEQVTETAKSDAS